VIVPVVVLAVIALAALVWAFLTFRGLQTARERIDQLETRLLQSDRELTETKTRLTAAERAAEESAEELQAERQRAAEADQAAQRAMARLEAETRRAGEAERAAQRSAARAKLEARRAIEAEAARVEADTQRETALQGMGLLRPDGLWALEKVRVERLWRDRLALLPEDVSPLADTDAEGEAAVKIFAEASREESGVVIDLSWQVHDPPDPALAVVLVRLAEELIAATRRANGGELAVETGPSSVLFRLRADPPVPAPEALAAACASSGWTLTDTEEGAIEIRVPVGARPVIDVTDGAAAAQNGRPRPQAPVAGPS
jgi:hypothetical protein